MSGLRPIRSQLTRQQRQQQSWQSLQNLCSNLQTAVNNSIASSNNYDSVEVPALHWENDKMGVARLETELLELLSRGYNLIITAKHMLLYPPTFRKSHSVKSLLTGRILARKVIRCEFTFTQAMPPVQGQQTSFGRLG